MSYYLETKQALALVTGTTEDNYGSFFVNYARNHFMVEATTRYDDIVTRDEINIISNQVTIYRTVTHKFYAESERYYALKANADKSVSFEDMIELALALYQDWTKDRETAGVFLTDKPECQLVVERKNY